MRVVCNRCLSPPCHPFFVATKKWKESVHRPFRPIFGSFQKMDGVCPSSVPSNFLELPKKGRCLSVVRSVLFLGAFKEWTESVHRPFRPIFGSFQKMDGVCPSSVQSNFWDLPKKGGCLSLPCHPFFGASKKWMESPSSVQSNLWELPKNGWSLSIVRAVQFLGASKKGTVSVCRPFRPIFGSFQKMDGVCPSSVPSNFWELPKNGRSLSIVRATVSVCRPFRPIFGSFQKMDGVCPSSVQLNFWEFPKNGGGL
jgi:hypothetical protein